MALLHATLCSLAVVPAPEGQVCNVLRTGVHGGGVDDTAAWLPASDSRIHFLGRHLANGSSSVQFDWVGTGLEITFASGADHRIGPSPLLIDMAAPTHTRFEVYVDGRPTRSCFVSDPDRTTLTLVDDVEAGSRVTILKATEPLSNDAAPVEVFRIGVPAGLAVRPPAQARHLVEVFGDSDSASYGVEASTSAGDALGCVLEPYRFENFARGWVRRLVETLNANATGGRALVDASVQAISGIGVTRNAGESGPPMPAYLNRTLQTVDASDFAPTSRPALVVLYLGSNDYVEWGEPSDAVFRAAYAQFADRVVALFGAPPPPVLHVCGGEARPCELIEGIVNASAGRAVYSTAGDTGVPKGGCLGHRNTTQQQAVAEYLRPLVARLLRGV